jgi:agmatinase
MKASLSSISLTNEDIFDLHFDQGEASIVLLPIGFDATSSYGRASALAPNAIREASQQVDLFHTMLAPTPFPACCLLQPHPAMEAFNQQARLWVDQCRQHAKDTTTYANAQDDINNAGNILQKWSYDLTQKLLCEGKCVGVIGGDHSVPLGSMIAHIDHRPDMGVLHFDAHADLRDAYEGFTHSHASIMHNLLDLTALRSLVQVGVRDLCAFEWQRTQNDPRIHTLFGDTLHQQLFQGRSLASIVQPFIETLPNDVYISFDIDGLDPSYCPHTGTPVPGGLSYAQAVFIMQEVIRSGRHIIGFDLTEVAPGPHDEYDANVGARMVYELCCLCELSRQENQPKKKAS